MKQLIMVKYAELTTKKDNKGFFVRILKENIISALEGLDFEIKTNFARVYIYTEDISDTVERLKKFSGIH